MAKSPANNDQPGVDERVSPLEMSIPGFGPAAMPDKPFAEFDGDHELALSNALDRLHSFVAARDPVSLLSLFGRQHLIESMSSDRDESELVIQSEVELLQTIALTFSKWGEVPTSPNNFLRCRKTVRDCLNHYAVTSRPEGDDVEALLSHRVRIQSLFYRNSFSSDVGSTIVPALLSRIDAQTNAVLGYKISDLAHATFDILQFVAQRMGDFRTRIGAVCRGEGVETEVRELAALSVAVNRVLAKTQCWFVANDWPSDAAFQASEVGWSYVFSFSRQELIDRYGEAVTSALFKLGIRPGELANLDLREAFLGSPIRQRPFILLSDNQLFVPNPGLVVSFIFEMVEHVLRAHPNLLEAYHRARANYLPKAVEALVNEALPSAKMYREVAWHDPSSDTRYENDVLAVIGHHVFIFEAKAGKLKPAARRGGLSSLKKNLKELFIEPARQAARLEGLLQSGQVQSGMLVDRDGNAVDIDTGRPIKVRKFSICLEHFAGLTSTRHSYVDLGLLAKGDPWAPILSLGELHTIGMHLDAEPAYFHYLSRRQTIEEQLDFMGDEQDLLSVYLANRFCLNEESLADMRVMFFGADELARETKTPASNRERFEMPGIKLPFLWQRISTKIYESGIQHRFDMLEVILNQHPAELKGLEQRAIRWNRGLSTKEDIGFIRRVIGSQVFGLALAHVKRPPITGADLGLFSRQVLQSVAPSDWPSDFLLVIRSQKKSTATYDGVHFARLQRQ